MPLTPAGKKEVGTMNWNRGARGAAVCVLVEQRASDAADYRCKSQHRC